MRKALLLAAAFALIATACGDDDAPGAAAAATPAPTVATTASPATAPSTTATPATTAAPPPTAAPATTPPPEPSGDTSVRVAASGLGDVLVDGDGNTLYLFLPDEAGPSVCNDACANAWPPLIGDPVAGDGIDAALLGTATRDDGTTQATYNGWPLYHFQGDSTAGDTNGQGINDIWWVISPTGDAMM